MEVEISPQEVLEVRHFYGLILNFKLLTLKVFMVKEGEKHKRVGCALIVSRCFAAIYTLHLLPFKHKALTFVLTSRMKKTTNTLSRFKVSVLSLHAIAFSHKPTSLVSHSWDMVLPT